MYQDDMCGVIDLFEQVENEYNHKEFIITEVRRARNEALNNPTSGNVLSLIVWLDTLVHELDKETAEETIKISA